MQRRLRITLPMIEEKGGYRPVTEKKHKEGNIIYYRIYQLVIEYEFMKENHGQG